MTELKRKQVCIIKKEDFPQSHKKCNSNFLSLHWVSKYQDECRLEGCTRPGEVTRPGEADEVFVLVFFLSLAKELKTQFQADFGMAEWHPSPPNPLHQDVPPTCALMASKPHYPSTNHNEL